MKRLRTQGLSHSESVAVRRGWTRTVYTCVVLLALASASITTMAHKRLYHHDRSASLLSLPSKCPPGVRLDDRHVAASPERCSVPATRSK